MKYQNLDDNEILYLISENDEEAYNYMYCKYKPLISKFATVILKNFKYLNLEYDDLIQEGMYGLSLAIKRFDNTSDNIFFTLCWCYWLLLNYWIFRCSFFLFWFNKIHIYFVENC